jgi:hypothetical protein
MVLSYRDGRLFFLHKVAAAGLLTTVLVIQTKIFCTQLLTRIFYESVSVNYAKVLGQAAGVSAVASVKS